MKIQIARLSPHQNAKVFAVLTALSSLIFAIPMFIGFLMLPAVNPAGQPVNTPPPAIAFLFPLLYLVIGYIMIVIGCWFYNFMFKYLGGIEYETREQ
jgi:hypothetical protein